MKTTFGLPIKETISARFRRARLSRRGHDPTLAALRRPAGLILALVAAGLASVARGQVITEFAIPTPDSAPSYITTGSDGNLWFTESYPADRIWRITTSGVATEFSGPAAGSAPHGITAGPDGNLWFTEIQGNKIGRITAAGVITVFSIPTVYTGPWGITTGPDGNLWFTERFAQKIGRITTAGVVTEFEIPSFSASPSGIASGPDGALWFTEGANKIGRITTAGVVTEFPIPTANSGPVGIAAGPDGNLWFTEFTANQIGQIGRITTAGVITEFSISTAGSRPWDIAAGPDGNLWFTVQDLGAGTNNIGRITPAGVITEFSIPTANSLPTGIASGPDGNLWFTEYSASQIGQIGRITTAPTTPQIMAVDAHAVIGSNSNANGVLEPGETVQVDPSWANTLTSPQSLTGTASNLTGPAGASYTIDDNSADYGTVNAGATGDCDTATGDCYLMTVSGARPAAHWDATFTEDLSSNSITKVRTLHVGESFPDVPTSDQFYGFIENLFHNGVTVGYLDGGYHPTDSITRAQMAVFLLKGKFGASHVAPPATGTVFHDVQVDAFAADWIEELAGFQITGGCGNGNYCPNEPVTRAQMAVFLLKSEHGSSYTPPICAGIFTDVPCPSTVDFPYSNWIEQLAAEGITGGCGDGIYCPNDPNTRGEMAVFLVKTFDLILYGSPPTPQAYTVERLCLPASCGGNVGTECFLPSTTHIRVGDTIDWVWSSGVHSTTSGHPSAPDGKWDSGTQTGPFAFSHTFTETGTFAYYCSPGHVKWFKPCWMCGCVSALASETGVVIVGP